MTKETFGQLLRRYRKAAAMTQDDLARSLPPNDDGSTVKTSSIGAWERDLYLPRFRTTVERIETLLDVPDHELLNGAGLFVDSGIEYATKAELGALAEVVRVLRERLDQIIPSTD